MASRIEGSQVFVDPVTFQNTVSLPDDVIDDGAIAEQRHYKGYAQANTAASDETRHIHTVTGATGRVLSFGAGSIAKAVGDATCTIDLKKNGSSVLSAVITLNSSSTNRVFQYATISSATMADGDFYEVVIDGTIGTGTLPTGVCCEMCFVEDND